jgi:hypothetical protein
VASTFTTAKVIKKGSKKSLSVFLEWWQRLKRKREISRRNKTIQQITEIFSRDS